MLTQLLGLSYAEAAAVEGVPVGTIRSRVARARDDLVEAVGDAADRLSAELPARDGTTNERDRTHRTGAGRWPAVRPWLGIAARLGLAAVWLVAGGVQGR